MPLFLIKNEFFKFDKICGNFNPQTYVTVRANNKAPNKTRMAQLAALRPADPRSEYQP